MILVMMRCCLICSRTEYGRVSLRWRWHHILHVIRGEA